MHRLFKKPGAKSTMTWLYKPWCDANRGASPPLMAPEPPRLNTTRALAFVKALHRHG